MTMTDADLWPVVQMLRAAAAARLSFRPGWPHSCYTIDGLRIIPGSVDHDTITVMIAAGLLTLPALDPDAAPPVSMPVRPGIVGCACTPDPALMPSETEGAR